MSDPMVVISATNFTLGNPYCETGNFAVSNSALHWPEEFLIQGLQSHWKGSSLPRFGEDQVQD